MDLNEQFARGQMAAALQRGATAAGSDAASMEVVRTARLEAERAKARSILDEQELFATVGARTRDDFTTEVLPALVALGWILGNQPSTPNGPQLRGGGLLPLTVDRWSLDRWLSHFDAAAAALGYVKAAPRGVSAARWLVVLAVALGAGLLS